MTQYTFEPDYELKAKSQGHYPIEAFSDEVEAWGAAGCYAAAPEYVRRHGGPLSNMLLEAVPGIFYNKAAELDMLPNIDIRIHRLNPGEYPAVPGWHCDGALRETYFGQPELDRIQIRDTIIGCISSHPEGVSNVEIADEPVTVELPGNPNKDFKLWQTVDSQVSNIKTKKTRDGELYRLTVNTLHRASPARHRGWRLFFRISMWHNNYLGELGKKAYSQQVYLTQVNGW